MNVHSDREVHLIKSAIRLAAHAGPGGFSMKALAAEAGLATGTAYGYFKSREELLLQAYMLCLSEVSQAMVQALRENASFSENYMHIWHALWQYCMDEPDVILCRRQFESLPAAQDEQARAHQETVFAPIWAWFESAQAAGEMAPLPQPVIGALCFEPCLSLARSCIVECLNPNEIPLATVCQASLAAITHGLDK